MAVDLVPSVLARTSGAYEKEKKIAEQLNPWIHLDVMDGVFVPSRSITPAIVQRSKPRANVEYHLMTRHPGAWAVTILGTTKARVILHLELGAALRPWLALFRSQRISTWLAINPTSTLDRLWPWMPFISGVLVMSVRPGGYSHHWWAGSLARVRAIRHRYPHLIIGLDGGMDQETIPRAAAAGARHIVVGSAVMLDEHPTAAWEKLRRLV
ncbi:MAG: hypothetical protein HY092_00345 [Candidatus Kerfeldbacteria bacterium]|nr:hypothetical protein [Candidatus Kerfeldbacteria bacterium]